MTNQNPHFYDFSKEYKDYSVFIPAISEMYARYVTIPNPKRLPPAPLTRQDFDFLQPNGKLYYLPKALYSAGQAAKSDGAAAEVDMVSGRDRSYDTTIVGDSGGFQIETGTIRWEGDRTKERMLRWLEKNADWSMILDFPTGSIDRRGHDTYYEEWCFDENGAPIYDRVPVLLEDGSPKFDKKGKQVFKRVPRTIKHKLDFWFCLDRTIENNHYFIENRVPGATKFLNVLQGRYHDFGIDEEWIHNLDFVNLPREEQERMLREHEISEVDAWYKHVREFGRNYGNRNFEGWALAGHHKEDFALTLRRLVVMLHDEMLYDKEWTHFLGMGKLKNGCVFTTIQRMIRQHPLGNNNFTISYDVSSPFTTAAYGNVITGFDLTKDSWSIQSDKCDGKQYIGSTEPVHSVNSKVYLKSPLTEYITMGDLCVNDDERFRSSWDVCSYAMMMNHNVFMHVNAIMEAQKLYDLPVEEARDYVPAELLTIKHLIEDIMVLPRDKALNEIARYREQLRLLSSSNANGGISTIENDLLFESPMKTYVKPSKRVKEEPVEKEDTSTFDQLFT